MDAPPVLKEEPEEPKTETVSDHPIIGRTPSTRKISLSSTLKNLPETILEVQESSDESQNSLAEQKKDTSS